MVFDTNYRLMQVKSIAECSNLQYFRPSLSYYNLSFRSLFCIFWSERFTQVLLCCSHLVEKERAGCFTLTVFLLSLGCYCTVPLPRSTVG